MKVKAAFPSKYLNADDLNGKRVAVTIARVEIEKVNDEVKPIVYFKGKKKGLVLNKTNAESITELTGTDEMDDWGGTEIVVHPDKTMYAGKMVPCIRVAEVPVASSNGKKAPARAKADESEFASDDDAPEPGSDFGDDDEGFV